LLRWCAAAIVMVAAMLLGAAFLATVPPSLERAQQISPEVEDAEGHLLRGFPTPQGSWRFAARLGEISPLYLDMLVAYEDNRFYSHVGVDPLAAARAAWHLVRHGRVVSGASTISMQTARLLEANSHTIGGKLRQVAKAIALEREHTKNEILELYLTLTPFGGNLEGVRAASFAYFGKEPRRLSAAEAALLVALPQAPRLRPDRFPEAARNARDRVLQRLATRGKLDAQVAAAAMREPIPTERRAMPAHAPHLARAWLSEARAVGHLRSTVDGTLQRRIEGIVANERTALDPAANLAILVVRNADAAVVAHIGSADFGDLERAGEVDFSRAARSPGSALKPFVYGLAFETLLVHPDTVVLDGPARYGRYTPTNFEGEYVGLTTVRDALLHSLNTTAVAILDAVGPERLVARFRVAGVALHLSEPDSQAGPAIAVGSCGITLEDLVTLYAAFADRGLVRPLRFRSDTAAAPGTRLFSADAAWAVADILASARRPAGPAPDQAEIRRRVAYKTGTSAGYRDAWSVGFDAAHTVGVWVGRPDAAAMPGRFGRVTAAPLLFRVFDLLPEPLADPAGPPPPGTPLAVRGNLPPRLARFEPRSMERGIPIIDTPADAAEMAVTASGIALRGRGGHPPYRWYIDGRPLGPPADTIEALWHPDGRGSTRLELVDGEGRSAAITVWVGSIRDR
jgi:penicillin-binding protein 1C